MGVSDMHSQQGVRLCANTHQGHHCDGVEGHDHKMHWSEEGGIEWPAHLPFVAPVARPPHCVTCACGVE